jgi:hypothetical protein
MLKQKKNNRIFGLVLAAEILVYPQVAQAAISYNTMAKAAKTSFQLIKKAPQMYEIYIKNPELPQQDIRTTLRNFKETCDEVNCREFFSGIEKLWGAETRSESQHIVKFRMIMEKSKCEQSGLDEAVRARRTVKHILP